jgi:hypothetical protein
MGLAIRLTPEEPIGTNRPAGSLPGKSGDILEVGVAPPPFCLPLSVLLDFTIDCPQPRICSCSHLSTGDMLACTKQTGPAGRSQDSLDCLILTPVHLEREGLANAKTRAADAQGCSLAV